jgi:hypothetical protein
MIDAGGLMWIVILWSMVFAGTVGAILGRRYERGRWHERLLKEKSDEPKRLLEATEAARVAASANSAQVAEALDVIAIEVERIGESQRFLTKLLTDRSPRTGTGRTPSPIPGAVRSPIPPSA